MHLLPSTISGVMEMAFSPDVPRLRDTLLRETLPSRCRRRSAGIGPALVRKGDWHSSSADKQCGFKMGEGGRGQN